MDSSELNQEIHGDVLRAPAASAVPFKDLVYKLPDTGFDPSRRPVRLAEIKDQRLPHEREDAVAAVAKTRGSPKSNGLPTRMHFETGQARSAMRRTALAQLDSGYLEAVVGEQDA